MFAKSYPCEDEHAVWQMMASIKKSGFLIHVYLVLFGQDNISAGSFLLWGRHLENTLWCAKSSCENERAT